MSIEIVHFAAVVVAVHLGLSHLQIAGNGSVPATARAAGRLLGRAIVFTVAATSGRNIVLWMLAGEVLARDAIERLRDVPLRLT